jgi:antitoxin component of MazEF toxin-antitoxin module
MTVKTRKQGNSLMITIPARFNIAQDTEFEAVFEDGILSYIPVHHNIFNSKPDYDLRAAMTKEGTIENDLLVGHEDVWND